MALEIGRLAKFGIALVAATFLGAIALVFFTRTDCCEQSDPVMEALNSAAHAGDISAISELYRRAAEEGVKPMAEYWALEGAIRGDRQLRVEFLRRYSRLDKERKQSLLASIKERSVLPGASCLLRLLGEESPNVGSSPECQPAR